MPDRRADEQAVRDVLMLYFVGLDRRDTAAFERVFTEDARMSVLGGAQRFAGRADIIPALMNVAAYPMSSHHPTSQRIQIEDDTATADTYAVAYLATHDERIVVRGIQYVDRLRRAPDGWRIDDRQHIPQWQYEAAATPLALPS